jgi:hypothetical protein
MAPQKTDLDDAFEAAVKMSEEGLHEEAARLLEESLRDRVERRPRLAAAHAKLGHIYLSKLLRPADAEPHFRKAASLSASSEVASLGLFHALMQQRMVAEAMAEMERFTATNPSVEYEQLRAEMTEVGTRAEKDDDES